MENCLENLIYTTYLLPVDTITPILAGVGGATYLVKSKQKKFVLKVVKPDAMNHPEREPLLCNHLRADGISVPQYVKNKEGAYYSKANGDIFHLQTYIEGTHYAVHTAPAWLMNKSAITLAKIHQSISSFRKLPVGIGSDFFKRMTPERAALSYKNSIRLAKEKGHEELVGELKFRLQLVENFPHYDFDIAKLTYANTHGDYTINQIVCSEDDITGIVDWTCACSHPVIWELVRSFAYASPSAVEGEIHMEKLLEYCEQYLLAGKLNSYDRDHMLQLYYYQIAVCDYYAQYLNAEEPNKEEYLWQAKYATKVLQYLSENIESLTKEIRNNLILT